MVIQIKLQFHQSNAKTLFLFASIIKYIEYVLRIDSVQLTPERDVIHILKFHNITLDVTNREKSKQNRKHILLKTVSLDIIYTKLVDDNWKTDDSYLICVTIPQLYRVAGCSSAKVTLNYYVIDRFLLIFVQKFIVVDCYFCVCAEKRHSHRLYGWIIIKMRMNAFEERNSYADVRLV